MFMNPNKRKKLIKLTKIIIYPNLDILVFFPLILDF